MMLKAFKEIGFGLVVRHDGKLSKDGSIIMELRENIGIGIVGDNVLTNDGKWEKIRI